MHLLPLWDLIFTQEEIINYQIKKYALVCVDVYSRYVKARSMDRKFGETIATTLDSILSIMGKPQIISADNEIINPLKTYKSYLRNIDGVRLYDTSPHELNKNAIVERMIRTLKSSMQKSASRTIFYLNFGRIMPAKKSKKKCFRNITLWGFAGDFIEIFGFGLEFWNNIGFKCCYR
jgi:transposase InsO family protein